MILVDTSVWIEYFRGTDRSVILNDLIDNNTVCINDLILSELLPSINQHKEFELKELLLSVTKVEMHINWQEIILMQTQNLLKGINKVRIADLLIVQNILQNNYQIYSYDKHFFMISELFDIRMFNTLA